MNRTEKLELAKSLHAVRTRIVELSDPEEIKAAKDEAEQLKSRILGKPQLKVVGGTEDPKPKETGFGGTDTQHMIKALKSFGYSVQQAIFGNEIIFNEYKLKPHGSGQYAVNKAGVSLGVMSFDDVIALVNGQDKVELPEFLKDLAIQESTKASIEHALGAGLSISEFFRSPEYKDTAEATTDVIVSAVFTRLAAMDFEYDGKKTSQHKASGVEAMYRSDQYPAPIFSIRSGQLEIDYDISDERNSGIEGLLGVVKANSKPDYEMINSEDPNYFELNGSPTPWPDEIAGYPRMEPFLSQNSHYGKGDKSAIWVIPQEKGLDYRFYSQIDGREPESGSAGNLKDLEEKFKVYIGSVSADMTVEQKALLRRIELENELDSIGAERIAFEQERGAVKGAMGLIQEEIRLDPQYRKINQRAAAVKDRLSKHLSGQAKPFIKKWNKERRDMFGMGNLEENERKYAKHILGFDPYEDFNKSAESAVVDPEQEGSSGEEYSVKLDALRLRREANVSDVSGADGKLTIEKNGETFVFRPKGSGEDRVYMDDFEELSLDQLIERLNEAPKPAAEADPVKDAIETLDAIISGSETDPDTVDAAIEEAFEALDRAGLAEEYDDKLNLAADKLSELYAATAGGE